MASITISGEYFETRLLATIKARDEAKETFRKKCIWDYVDEQNRYRKDILNKRLRVKWGWIKPTKPMLFAEAEDILTNTSSWELGFFNVTRRVKIHFEKIDARIQNYQLLLGLLKSEVSDEETWKWQDVTITEKDAQFLGF